MLELEENYETKHVVCYTAMHELLINLLHGLAVPVVGSHAFEVAHHYVDECVTCSEKEIAVVVLRLV